MTSVKTCLLCGKPLRKVWVGAGDNYCSREHRNQHRLRRGMDRVSEANKMATLMRRRETPRPISPGRLMNEGGITPKGFLQAKRSAACFKIAFPGPVPSPFHPRIPAKSAAYLGPRPAQMAQTAVPLPISSTATGLSQRTALAIASFSRGVKSPTRFPQARIARLRLHLLKGGVDPRKYSFLRQPLGRLRQGPFKAAATAAVCRLTQAVRLRPLSPTRNNGDALPAVSEFRQPRPVLRRPEVRFRGAPAAALAQSPSAKVPVHPSIKRPAPRGARVRASQSNLSLPPVPGIGLAVQLALPDIIPAPRQRPWEPDAREPLHFGLRLDLPTMTDPFRSMSAWSKPLTGLSHVNGQHCLPLPPVPAAGDATHRVGLAPFEPAESVFGRAQIGIQGTVMGSTAMGSNGHDAIQSPGPVSTLLEEHFDSGWGNWTAGTEDWKLDAAGVRTGSFALFTPSLGMRDYDVEFLARIDNRSVTWVYRAAGPQDYFAASIAITSDGGYEFTRRAVIGGADEPASTVHLRLTPGSKAAIKVRMRVEGGEFAVSVDGETIDSWMDPRLATGGIGFTGSPEDRARLYWVRLSSKETFAKE